MTEIPPLESDEDVNKITALPNKSLKAEIKKEPCTALPRFTKEEVLRLHKQIYPQKPNRLQTFIDSLPSIPLWSVIKLCAIVVIFLITFQTYTGIIYPILHFPANVQKKLNNLTVFIPPFIKDPNWDSFTSYFSSKIISTNFTSRLSESLEHISDLDVKSLASLSSSLNTASSLLNDLPLTAHNFPNKQVQLENEIFRERLRKLAEELRSSYKFTWQTFLKSSSFMERGARLITRITEQAKLSRSDRAATLLETLLNEIVELQTAHEDADEKLEIVYMQVNELSRDAKEQSLRHVKEAGKLESGWTMEQKITTYGLGLILGAMTGGLSAAVPGAAFVGFYQWVDNDKQKLQAAKYEKVAVDFHKAYEALNQTRHILHRDIQILALIGHRLRTLIHDVQDVGIALTEDDLIELEALGHETRDKFLYMQREYNSLLNPDSEEVSNYALPDHTDGS